MSEVVRDVIDGRLAHQKPTGPDYCWLLEFYTDDGDRWRASSRQWGHDKLADALHIKEAVRRSEPPGARYRIRNVHTGQIIL